MINPMSLEQFSSLYTEELTAEYHSLNEGISSIFSLEDFVESEYGTYLAFFELQHGSDEDVPF